MQCIYGAWCIIYMNEHLAVKQLICKIPSNFTYHANTLSGNLLINLPENFGN